MPMLWHDHLNPANVTSPLAVTTALRDELETMGKEKSLNLACG